MARILTITTTTEAAALTVSDRLQCVHCVLQRQILRSNHGFVLTVAHERGCRMVGIKPVKRR